MLRITWLFFRTVQNLYTQ